MNILYCLFSLKHCKPFIRWTDKDKLLSALKSLNSPNSLNTLNMFIMMVSELIFSQEKEANSDFICYKMFKWHWNTYVSKR